MATHTDGLTHSENTTINTLSLSIFFVHTHTCKTIQMFLINACSAREQDPHYFMLCGSNWSKDKMISEGIFHVIVIFLFLWKFILREKRLSLDVCVCVLGFDPETWDTQHIRVRPSSEILLVFPAKRCDPPATVQILWRATLTCNCGGNRPELIMSCFHEAFPLVSCVKTVIFLEFCTIDTCRVFL